MGTVTVAIMKVKVEKLDTVDERLIKIEKTLTELLRDMRFFLSVHELALRNGQLLMQHSDLGSSTQKENLAIVRIIRKSGKVRFCHKK